MNNYCKLLSDIVLVNSVDSRKEVASSSRLPIQLERLPASQLKEVVAALIVLKNAGLSEVNDVTGMLSLLENSKQLRNISEKAGISKLENRPHVCFGTFEQGVNNTTNLVKLQW